MTDIIQRYLEDMVPELEDLEERNIISKTERISIIKRRTKFEYSIKRRQPHKIDFLRYIEYEDNLDKLIKERRSRTEFKNGKLGKTSRGDYSGQQRVCKVYERAVNRFHGDVKLWLQYTEYLKSKKATRVLSKTLARALQLHPTKPLLWIYAAAWEFEDNGSIVAARAMMQRGLRFNSNSKELWIEYFRLELAYMEMIRRRRLVLGIGKASESTGKSETNTMDATNDNDDLNRDMIQFDIAEPKEPASAQHKELINRTAAASTQADDSDNSLLEGTIARIVYQFAIKEIPNDLQFRKQFLDVYAQFPKFSNGQMQIYESIANDFGGKVEAQALLAERHLNGALPDTVAFIEGLRKCVKDYKMAIETIQSGEIREHYVLFLEKQLGKSNEENVRKYLIGSMKEAFEHAHHHEQTTAHLYVKWIQFTKSIFEDTVKAMEIAVLATDRYRDDEKLWIERLGLVSDRQRLGNHTSITYICIDALPSSSSLWRGYLTTIELLWRNDEINEEQVEQEYMEAVLHSTAQLGHVRTNDHTIAEEICALVQTQLVDWSFKHQGLNRMRLIVDRIVNAVPASKQLYEHCIKIEQNESELNTDRVAEQRINWLFDRMLQTNTADEGTFIIMT
ncbi:U3 small nucleolar RNA-associated protein 6-domain-containing protein [Syncephalis plumigaleata]|nr:U3 small nucleolar RNA-associated protein 6-domain-containing protein [Syncephalis plumigaleata]